MGDTRRRSTPICTKFSISAICLELSCAASAKITSNSGYFSAALSIWSFMATRQGSPRLHCDIPITNFSFSSSALTVTVLAARADAASAAVSRILMALFFIKPSISPAGKINILFLVSLFCCRSEERNFLPRISYQSFTLSACMNTAIMIRKPFTTS